ncbi:MAG: LysR family transcriptional regulator [Methyloceanibacter sp.]|nr:LysR family transcriptional regulator [Methyloceanibacter sp.]
MNEWIPKRMIGAIPLNGLRTFEVVARHMSLKKAAEELNVTPSAVSHRLRVLERILGCKLIQRHGAEMRLTENGRLLAPALADGFETITTALGSLRPG